MNAVMGKRQIQQAQFFQSQVDRLLAQRAQMLTDGTDAAGMKKIETEIRVLQGRIAKLVN